MDNVKRVLRIAFRFVSVAYLACLVYIVFVDHLFSGNVPLLILHMFMFRR